MTDEPAPRSRPSRSRSPALLLGAAIGGLVIGFATGVTRRAELHPNGADFVRVQSFSSVENARGVLDAECRRFLQDWTRRHAAVVRQRNQTTDAPHGDLSPEVLIAELQDKLIEFEGTTQATLLRRHLLSALFQNEDLGVWLDTYLQLLYESPGDPIIGEWAGRAVHTGRQLGRTAEVLTGLRHWTDVPFDRPAKERVRRQLTELET